MDDADFNLLQRPALQNDDAFAQRVINYALAQKRPLSWQERASKMWNEISEPIAIPKPAYVLAALALFGFLIGALNQQDAASLSGTEMAGIFYDTGEMI